MQWQVLLPCCVVCVEWFGAPRGQLVADDRGVEDDGAGDAFGHRPGDMPGAETRLAETDQDDLAESEGFNLRDRLFADGLVIPDHFRKTDLVDYGVRIGLDVHRGRTVGGVVRLCRRQDNEIRHRASSLVFIRSGWTARDCSALLAVMVMAMAVWIHWHGCGKLMRCSGVAWLYFAGRKTRALRKNSG